MMLRTLLLILILGLLAGCSGIPDNPPKTMTHINLKRYMGTWYEIASLPAPFQKNCFCTQAHYQLKQDHLAITNRCRKGSKTAQWEDATANGHVVPDSGNSQFKITFFWPFKANYWILYVSPDYQQAVVGTPDRKYLWLLARQKQISSSDFKHLKRIAKRRGYDLDQLSTTPQCLS